MFLAGNPILCRPSSRAAAAEPGGSSAAGGGQPSRVGRCGRVASRSSSSMASPDSSSRVDTGSHDRTIPRCGEAPAPASSSAPTPCSARAPVRRTPLPWCCRTSVAAPVPLPRGLAPESTSATIALGVCANAASWRSHSSSAGAPVGCATPSVTICRGHSSLPSSSSSAAGVVIE